MTSSNAKELFRYITADFFSGYMVIFTNQSRIAKPSIPLVTIQPGNVKRPNAANYDVVDGVMIGYYLSTITFTVDLFTNGTPITNGDGRIVAYENTAMDEILAFANYLNGIKCVALCNANDVSIMIESDAQDLTGIVNDNNYEYRARLEVLFSFTQSTNPVYEDVGSFESATVSMENC